MSIFTSIISGISKAENFLLNVFTKTNAVIATVTKLQPSVLAAMMATFYDVMKTAQAGAGAATAASSGNVLGAITLSNTTLALLQQVLADGATDTSLIAADLKALGIAAGVQTGTNATPQFITGMTIEPQV
jgi:hypothetical protein